MAQFENLKNAIRQVIKRNGNEEITGEILQQTLIAMVNIIGDGYVLKGFATPVTQPGTPDNNIFYFATQPGNYTAFGIEVVSGEIAVLMWNGVWQKQTLLNTGFSEQFVDFSTEQVIDALKTFAGGIKIPTFDEISDYAGTTMQDVLADKADISALQEIIAKIPAQASAENQLADKQFVNSSIASNTANFIGTFNSIEELEEYPTTGLTNNDYAFVIGNDGEGNRVYQRYKWNGTDWLFEYELNNSTFTASQWYTINSGLTSNDVTAIRAALTLIANVFPADATANNPLITRQYVEDRHIILPLLTLEATQEQLALVYNSIMNAPTGSAFFISLPENRGIMPLATAKFATSVFAQYSDGRYSHELKITLADGVYEFEKTDKTFATDTQIGDLAQLQTTEKSNIVGAINEIVQGGGESGKRGVISQKQTWVGTTNVYTLTDIVYGNIPFEAIDNYTMCYAEFLDMDGNLYTKNGVSTPTLEADGTLKRTTPWGEVIYQQKGYFYLNGIADLSYYDMRLIYNEAKGDIMWNTLPSLSATKARTHISFTRYGGAGDSGYYRCAYNYIFVTSEMLEVINVQMDNIRTDTRRQFTGGTVFTNLYHLRHIVGLIECTTPGNVFQNARLLESLTLTRLNASISFRWTPYLTRESIRYMIDNAINTSAITITLHADAYARLNDEDKAAATAKNINIVIA